MICHLCEKKTSEKIKTVDGIDIFECKRCYLAFVDQKKTNNLNSQKEYNFDRYKENGEKLRTRFKQIANKIQAYKKKGKILDVGAGYGLLSSILYEKGYEIFIIEPNNTAYYLKGKKIRHYRTPVEEFVSKSKTKYDVILLMDVIEHLKDPLTVLKKLRFHLNKKGIVVAQTPNYKSLMAKICKNWSWWMVSDHKFFFSTKSIHVLLKKAGFAVSELETYEDLHDFKKNLDGNFTFMQNSVFRKIIKGVLFVAFLPIYVGLRKILWKYHYGGLILTMASPV